MTEEQFWRSNPRIIKVWEKVWKDEQNRNNQLVHMYFGNYGLSAMMTAVSWVMQPMLCKGKKSKAKYIEEPVRLFPMTEEEKEAERERATQAFIAWGNAVAKQFESLNKT